MLCLAGAAIAGAASDSPNLEITRISISPQQILIEFNRPVVPLGRMEREAEELPITITPDVNCYWLWVSTQALACNLEAKDYLKPAREYAVTVEPGIRTMDGATIAETVTRSRVTELPQVSWARVRTWMHPGVPVFRVQFNQPVTRDSVESSLYFKVAGLDEPFAVLAEPHPYDRRPPVYPEWVDPATATEGQQARDDWRVTSATELLPGRTAVLNARAGLVSALGPLPGRERANLGRTVTFDEFRFEGVSCKNNAHESIRYLPDGSTVRVVLLSETGRSTRERLAPVTRERAMCNPLERVSLTFSTPVLPSQIARGVEFAPGLAGKREDYDPWEQVRDYSGLYGDGSRKADVYLPERLQAFQEYRVTNLPTGTGDTDAPTRIRDEFGRPLAGGFDVTFMTDHRKPDYKLLHGDAVLESGVDSEIPLYVTNLEKVRLPYRLLNRDGGRTGLAQVIEPPAVEDVAFALPAGVREMISADSGAVLGRIRTTPPTRAESSAWNYFWQVTPYQVHVKAGHYNTLVWVTRLANGKPVRAAEVRIVRRSFAGMFRGLNGSARPAEPVRTNRRGVAMLPGTGQLDPELETFRWCSREDPGCERLFVLVEGREGMALLPLDRSFLARSSEASRWQVRTRQQRRYGHVKAWGTTAQGIYRAGDTMQYKIYVRDQDVRTLVAPESAAYTLRIQDPAGNTVHEVKDIRLNRFGAAHGDYDVPETAVMGWYRFVLSADFTDIEWRPMRVLVTDFTPAPFRVSNELNGDLFGPGDTLRVDTSAALHSGGAYTQAEARVVVDLRRTGFGSSHPEASTFRFDTSTRPDRLHVHQEIGDLDDAGVHTARVELRAQGIVYGRLRAESAVRDDRGKYVTATAHADFSAVDRLVGLRRDQWVFRQKEPAEVSYIVVDDSGEPVADTRVRLRIERQVRKVAQVKGAGNAYLPRFSEEWVEAGECEGAPKYKALACAFTPEHAGSYRVTAVIEDSQGRRQQTEMHLWVVGEGRVVWWERPGYAMELVPESTEYEVGDTARYLVKNPFPGATALVSVERYGVIDQWQQKLAGSTPIIEFRIKPDYVPGAYLSVVVVSPRVASPPPESHQGLDYVDLGKPAFRMGYAEVPVIDPYKQLEVEVETGRELYKPREKVAVKLKARPRHGRRRPVEFAVAVLDEAVFDLIGQGEDYFDPYQGFFRLDAPDVENYSLLLRILGRQKFEKKGASPGGDGGAGPDMRTLFKYVAHWEPSLPANRRGEADFEFSLPENLTGWRVLAMAATEADRFGLGTASFKTNQPTEIRPVMPNQVTEGDAFAAAFSVMNRTGEVRTIDVVIEAEGDIESKEPARAAESLELGPYRRETVYLPLTAGRLRTVRDRPQGEINFRVQARDASDGDALAHRLPVLKNRSFEVAAKYGSVTDQPASEEVLFPEDMYTDTGDVSVAFSPTVIGNLEGAFRYMRDYPYLCWEQKLSKALLAAQFTELKGRMQDSVSWPGSAALPAQTLRQAAGFQAPNGGMSYWIAADRHASPYLSAYTALGFSWLRAAGYEIPDHVETRLHDYLRNLLRRDVMPGYYSRGMSSSVRAVTLAALARGGRLARSELLRYSDQVQYMSLFGKAHFLDAALQTGSSETLARSVLREVMDASVDSAGKRLFNEQLDRGYARILSSPLRANCALLSAFSRLQNPAEYGLSEEMATGMVRALTQSRGARTHWESTQENAFCMNALLDYARTWEAVEPDMRAVAELDDTRIGETRFRDFRDAAVTLSLPISSGHPGKRSRIRVSREGQGRLYYAARLTYAPRGAAAGRVNAGIAVRREYSVQRDGEWRLLAGSDTVRRGELVRVDLFVELPAARNFVVVDDPVPGGLEPVNRDLATASGVDVEEGAFTAAGGSWWFDYDDWNYFRSQHWSFYHQEMGHDAVRFYSDYLPPGRYHLAYTAQAIAEGEFQVRPTHAGEMYDLDIYGKSAALRLVIQSEAGSQ